MIKTVLILFILSIAFSTIHAAESKSAAGEEAAIKKAALDYIEGWFSGSEERMARALHPSMKKVGLRSYRKDGKKVLVPQNYTSMVELARMGVGKVKQLAKAKISVKVLDIYKNTASVKTVCFQFIDYLHLAKMNGKWKIVNILWEPVKK